VKNMKIHKAMCLLAAIAAFGNFFVSIDAVGAAMDCSGTKKSKAAPYKEVIRPCDRPDHEMIQAIRTHVISSNDADFDGSEQTVYAHQDAYAGSGTSVGYFLYTLKSGEKIWAKFDSVYSTTPTQSSWEATYQGVFRFVGGTGKYANIHGGGHYEGKITPSAGFEESFVCSAQY
jgi:hypothetical protein